MRENGTVHPGVRGLPVLGLSCFDRIVIHGYRSGSSRREQVVYFWKMIGFPGARYDYRDWIEAYARKKIPVEWAERGTRKEDYVLPALRRLDKNACGVYFIFESMGQGRTFGISMPKFPTQDPNHRILAH